ncbi:hypothetical protein [Porphyromonas vaginalis]|uniref:hypothetical protein n=1 Tax=Porphyromonas vaginalis TaxID=3044325 RepID=UPI002609A3EE|nr:hypothetical protein [Porphyromonas vaginalis]
MILESLDKHDQEMPGADVTGAQAQESDGAGENQSNQSYRSNQSNQSAQSGVAEDGRTRRSAPTEGDGRTRRSAPTNREPSGGVVSERVDGVGANGQSGGGVTGVGAGVSGGVPAGGGVRVPLIGAGGAGAGAGAGGQEVVGTQGGGLPTKSMGVVDWAKVIDGYRQSQRAETPVAGAQGSEAQGSEAQGSEAQGSEVSEPSERSEPSEGAVSIGDSVGTNGQSEGAVTESSGGAVAGQSGSTNSSGEGTETQVGGDSGAGAGAEAGGGVSLEPMDDVEVARERKARAVERVVEGLRDETFYNALMRGVEDPREVQRKREAYRRKGAAWRSMVSLADMVANAIDAYGADRNAYTLERGLGTARYDQMLTRELSRLDSEYRLAEGLERDALGKVQGREDRARAVELQDARDDLAGAKAERAERARRAREEEEKKYRADRDKVRDDHWDKEFKERQEDRKARRALQARRLNPQARGGGSGRGAVRGGRGGSRGGGRSVFFDVWGKNSWNHELLVPEGNEKEFRESAIRYGRSNAGWLIKKNPVYVRTYAAQMGLPTGGASTSDLLRMVRKEGKMDDLYAGLAMTSRGFLLSRSVSYGDGEALTRVMEETVSPVRGAVVRGISDGDRKRIAGLMAKSIVADANACDVSVGEMYQVYESEMYAGVGDNAVGRVDKFMDEVASSL